MKHSPGTATDAHEWSELGAIRITSSHPVTDGTLFRCRKCDMVAFWDGDYMTEYEDSNTFVFREKLPSCGERIIQSVTNS